MGLYWILVGLLLISCVLHIRAIRHHRRTVRRHTKHIQLLETILSGNLDKRTLKSCVSLKTSLDGWDTSNIESIDSYMKRTKSQ